MKTTPLNPPRLSRCLGITVACLLFPVISPSAFAYDVIDGDTWTDTSGTASVVLLGSATLGANNSIADLTISAPANGKSLLQNGSFDTISLSGSITFTHNVAYNINTRFVYTGTGPLILAVNTGLYQFSNTSLTTPGSFQSSSGFTKNGSGYIVIRSDNSSILSGPVTINAGYLTMIGAGKLSSSVALELNNGTFTLQDGNNTTVDTVTMNGGSIVLGGTSTQANASLTANSFSLKKGSVGANLAGASATLTKTTADTVTLSGTNTYGGATTISAGIFALSGTGAINSSSGASVAAGATFRNNSSVAFSKTLNLAEGALIDGTGAFTPTATTITADISDDFTTFAFGATGFTKAGNLELTLAGITDGTYSLFSGSSISGSFVTTSINGFFLTDNGAGNFSGLIGLNNFDYSDSTNQLVVTSTIPEPGSFAALAGVMSALFVVGRRRRS